MEVELVMAIIALSIIALIIVWNTPRLLIADKRDKPGIWFDGYPSSMYPDYKS